MKALFIILTIIIGIFSCKNKQLEPDIINNYSTINYITNEPYKIGFEHLINSDDITINTMDGVTIKQFTVTNYIPYYELYLTGCLNARIKLSSGSNEYSFVLWTEFNIQIEFFQIYQSQYDFRINGNDYVIDFVMNYGDLLNVKIEAYNPVLSNYESKNNLFYLRYFKL